MILDAILAWANRRTPTLCALGHHRYFPVADDRGVRRQCVRCEVVAT